MSESRSQTPCASALRSPSTPARCEPLELAPAGEGVAPGPLQAALERVQVDARRRARRPPTPTASTSSSLAHCGAMIANCALSSGSPASSPTSAADRRDVGLVGHATSPRARRARRCRSGGSAAMNALVAVVGQARAVAPVRRERDALPRLAVGAQRVAQLARVGVLGRAVPGARREVHVQVRGHAGLDQQHVLGERPEVRIDRVEREHRRHPRLERRVAQTGRGRARIGESELHGRDRHAVVVGVDEARQHEHPVAAELLDARVLAAQLVALADGRDGAVADQHGAARQRRRRRRTRARCRRGRAGRACAGTLAAGASVRRWTRPMTAPRSRSGQTSSDRSAASRSLARCGWSASSALGSPGFRSICTPSTRPRGSRAPSSRRATGRARRTASASWFEDEGLVYAPPPDVVSNTRLALELGEGAREEGLHRAYHDRVMDAYWAEGTTSRSGRRSRSSRAAPGCPTTASRAHSTIAPGPPWSMPRPPAPRRPAPPACPRS